MKFQAIVCALVVLCSALSVNSSPAATYIQSKADQSLMNYMMKPRAGAFDSSNSLACFNYYIPLLNSITETYQKNYEACLSAANTELDALDEQGAEVRTNITAVSTDVCNLFSACQAESANLDFFDCYTNLGDQTVRQVYSISQDASVEAANYREMSRVIKATCDKCTNETQRVYVTDTANAYDELDDCLINGLKTTAAPDTTTPEVTTPEVTTIEDTTTEASTTEEPSTTPETTTADSTTTAATETPEQDPVEELKLAENTARTRLEAFVKNWNKRS